MIMSHVLYVPVVVGIWAVTRELLTHAGRNKVRQRGLVVGIGGVGSAAGIDLVPSSPVPSMDLTTYLAIGSLILYAIHFDGQQQQHEEGTRAAFRWA
ncbi:hypothetical protein Mapa_012480 [Marchantia paleacea]|nr:hypothetical protein Mapa_012480 [Marchantia paleacea]